MLKINSFIFTFWITEFYSLSSFVRKCLGNRKDFFLVEITFSVGIEKDRHISSLQEHDEAKGPLEILLSIWAGCQALICNLKIKA